MATLNDEGIAQRKKMIDWINQQDIFRTGSLIDHVGLSRKHKEVARVYVLLKYLRIDEYIQGLEKDQYVLLKKIPYDIKVDPNHLKRVP